MLGTGLGFGELGGVRIVVIEKRTFVIEMTDYGEHDFGEKDDDEDEEDGEVDQDEVCLPASLWKSRQPSGGFCRSCRSRGLCTRSTRRSTGSSSASSVGPPARGPPVLPVCPWMSSSLSSA